MDDILSYKKNRWKILISPPYRALSGLPDTSLLGESHRLLLVDPSLSRPRLATYVDGFTVVEGISLETSLYET